MIIEDLPGEIWKEYSDKEWLETYQFLISNYGRVKSFKYDKVNGRLIKGGRVGKRVVISGQDKNTLKTKHRYLSRIVAKLFLIKPDDCDIVTHKDGNYENNKVINLKWVTLKEKELLARQRTNSVNLGLNAKLTETQVIRLKKILHNPNRKTRLKIIAKQFGVSEMQLHRIKTGENWGHIKI